MFVRWNSVRPDVAELERVEALVRDRFTLGSGELVIVSEDELRDKGLPKAATTALFWAGGARHRIRVFKPAAEVTERDLPATWLRAALLDDGAAECC
jgi:hypothetical protein